MNVRIFKLVDGSEIIGRIKNFNNSAEIFKIEDPLEIKYRLSVETGYPIAVMTKYNFFGDELVIHINAHTVITSYEVSEKYVKVYESSLDSVRNIISNSEIVETKAEADNTPAPTIPLHKNTTVH